METFVMLCALWVLILIFSSANLYSHMKPVKAWLFSTLISLMVCALSVSIWFSSVTDGVSQAIGAMIFASFFGATTLALALVFWILPISKRKR